MVEKIIVSRDEVLHYSWLDHTWVYIYYPKNMLHEGDIIYTSVKGKGTTVDIILPILSIGE